MMQPLNLPKNQRMKASRHSGQVISNDDGFNPAKILDDLHAKSVREFEDQNICPSSREGIGVLNRLRYCAGKKGVTKWPEFAGARTWPLPPKFLTKNRT